MRKRFLSRITIRRKPGNSQRGWLTAGAMALPVALGRGGIKANKREGDGGTPRGRFRPRRLWWRADKHTRPATALPAQRIGADDGWCEDPSDRRYNQPIKVPPKSKADRLTRKDHLYDFIVEIDHNTRPRIAGRGSAVFVHGHIRRLVVVFRSVHRSVDQERTNESQNCQSLDGSRPIYRRH